MKIHISKNGQNIGQFLLVEVNRMLQSGQISADDLAWQDGMPQWVPVRSIPGVVLGVPTIPAHPQAAHSSGFAPANVSNYLVQSILVTLFCCLPLGIVAIINAAQVNNKLVAGDMAGALVASRKAKMWCWWSLGLSIVFWLIYIVFMMFIAVASEM
jgi:hypothetical protein